MAKRKEREHAADRPNGVVFDISGFGRFELLKDHFHKNPIWKKNHHVAKGKTCSDLVSSLPRFPRGQRSKGRVRRKKKSPVDGFGRFELLKDHFHKNPIWKKNHHVAKGKTCSDPVSSLPRFPRGQRSKGRVRRKKKSPVDETGSRIRNSKRISSSFGIALNHADVQAEGSHVGSIVEESQSQCYLDTYSRRPGNMQSKQEAEQSDSDVISKCSPCYGRQSNRQNHRTTDIQKWGKLDTGKFEFYLEIIWRRFTEEKRNMFTYLDSLWFFVYSKRPLKEKVLSWIKKKDIFSKKYVFVPIVQWGHWFLLILCNFGESPHSENRRRCMLLLDSLKEANSLQLEPGIRRFVFDIFKMEERPEKKTSINKIPLLIPQVPQQKNDDGCGFYVLYYVNLFLESAPDNFCLSMGYPHFTICTIISAWFATKF
ncbi:hypothetical protein OROMI_014009 [Orobanche minor]